MQYSLHIKFTTVLPVLLEPAAHGLCSRGREGQRYGEGGWLPCRAAVFSANGIAFGCQVLRHACVCLPFTAT